MVYELQKPCTDVQRADFISKYNHREGLEIKETETFLYALEKNEKFEKGIPVLNENYEQEQRNKRRKIFDKNFFKTSQGWVSKKIVIEKEEKDFFADILMQIKAALDMGIEVTIPVYGEPDFSLEQTEEYHKTLKIMIPATKDFIEECLRVSISNFGKKEE